MKGFPLKIRPMKMMFLFMLIYSCSHRPGSITEAEMKQIPNWVYSAYDYCSETSELCATGEGTSFLISDAEAKSHLESIFKESSQESFRSGLLGKSISEQLILKTKQKGQLAFAKTLRKVFDSIQIEKQFKNNDVYYSLAKIDREEGTRILNERLFKVDTTLGTFWKRKQRTLVRKMLILSAERNLIEEKLSILTPVYPPAPISSEQILTWALSPQTVKKVSLRVGHAPEWLITRFRTLLEEVGYELVDENTQNIITLNVTSLKEVMSTEKLERFTLAMNFSNVYEGKKIGEITKAETVLGRNQEEALLKVKASFLGYLEDQLYTLNLD